MSQEAIRVVLRLRPFLDDERSRQQRCVQTEGNTATIARPNGVGRTFTYDRVLDEKSSQSDVHEAVGLDKLVSAVLTGYNATIFAYGPTGTGKTHTMEGFMYQNAAGGPTATVNEAAEGGGSYGVIPTICAKLFEAARARQDAPGAGSITISCTYVQIYREQVYDLIGGDAGMRVDGGGGGAFGSGSRAGAGRPGGRAEGLRLRWLPGRGFYLEDCTTVQCGSADAALAMFRSGVKNKVMAGHRLNRASSRSHSIFTLNVMTYPPKGSADSTGIMRAQLTLVDLAGSERASMTGNTGLRLAESLFINKSLFTLRKVISVLAEAAREGVQERSLFVPYRDSKLTSLLQNSLGGSSITVCIACVSPGDLTWEETTSTLEYASMTRAISNSVVVNEDPRMRELRELREQVALLQQQLLERPPGSSQQPAALSRLEVPEIPAAAMDCSLVEQLKAQGAELDEGALQRLQEITVANSQLQQQCARLLQADKAQKAECEKLKSENADLRDTLSFFEELVSMEEGESSTGVAAGSAGGARELHTANRAVLLELLSLRQENSRLQSRCTVLETAHSTQGAVSRLRQSRQGAGTLSASMRLSRAPSGSASAATSRGASRAEPRADSAGGVAPLRLSTTGRVLGQGMLDLDQLVSVLGSAAPDSDHTPAAVFAPAAAAPDSDSQTQLSQLLRERMALARNRD